MGPKFMKAIIVGSKVQIIGTSEESIGKVIQIDLDGVAIVELKNRMVLCLPKDLILLK